MPRRFSPDGRGRKALPVVARSFKRETTHATRGLLCAALMLVATPGIGHAAGETWQVGTAPTFSSGKYGTDTRTEVLHTPMTARRLFEKGDLTLVFPITCIRGSGDVTVVNGSPVRRQQDVSRLDAPTVRPSGGSERGGRPGTSQTVRGDGGLDTRPDSRAPAQPVDSCGMGDIIVRGRYYLVDEYGRMPSIAVRAHLKTPTARRELGLGTGRPDEGIGIEVSRTLPGKVVAMADAGYTFVGRPAGVDFSNTWWYDVGLGRDVANGAVNLSVFFEEYSAIVPGLASARDLLAAVSLRGANGWRIQISGLLGVSDGAPDHGITLGASRRF